LFEDDRRGRDLDGQRPVPVAQVYRPRADLRPLRETAPHGRHVPVNVQWVLSDDAHAVAVYRAQGRREGRELDIDQVLLIDHADGIWQRIVAIPADPPAFEAFWA
jgi:hypothetical protein